MELIVSAPARANSLADRLAAHTTFECSAAGDGHHGAVERYQVTMFECAQGAGDGFARGADELTDLFVRQQKAKTRSVLGGLAVFAQVQQQAGEFFGRGRREANRAQLLAGHGVLHADLFGNKSVDFGMTPEKIEELGACDVGDLRGREGFGGCLTFRSQEGGRESEHLSGTSDAEREPLAIAGVHGEPDQSLADEEYAAGFLLLAEEQGACIVGCGGPNRGEVGERSGRKLLKKTATTKSPAFRLVSILRGWHLTAPSHFELRFRA